MKKRLTRLTTLVFSFLFVVVAFFALKVNAAPLKNVPQTLTQPNGEVIQCYASGDEYLNWLHDKDGYIIMQDSETGYYVYAQNQDSTLVPSKNLVGHFVPTDKTAVKTTNVPKQAIEKLKTQFRQEKAVTKIENAPKTGGLNNLVVFVRFQDQKEYTDLYSFYNSMFNNSAAGQSSMHNYFEQASYDKLHVNTGLYPIADSNGYVVSVVVPHPRDYYLPYNKVTNPIGYKPDVPEKTLQDYYINECDPNKRTDREFKMLKSAFESIEYQIPSNLNLDGDSDGEIDNVCFIVEGAAGGWSDLLWPHKWSMTNGTYYNQTRAYLNGKVVGTFNLQLSTELKSSGVGVLCHEMFHSIGAPDLYHYSYDGLTPVGSWDIMENDQNPPQNMTMYMKYKYGKWLTSIPEIKTSGQYTLNPSTSTTNNCYMIKSPYSDSEYFMLEYRKKASIFESKIPTSGLIISRINTAADSEGNRNGPPDEVYIYRPGGTAGTVESGAEDGDIYSAALSCDLGRTAPDKGLFLADGTYGGVKVSNVGSCKDSITFNVTLENKGMTLEPEFSLDEKGEYYSSQTLTLTCNTQGAVIRYTTDGTEPTTTSTEYKAPISISATAIIKAKAFAPGLIASNTVTKTYTVLKYPESAHKYANDFDYTWTYTADPSYKSMNVTFDAATEAEDGYDYIHVMDGNDKEIAGSPFTGKELAGRTVTVPGNVLRVRLKSDSGVNAYGFKVTNVTVGDSFITETYPKAGTATATTASVLLKAFSNVNAKYVVLSDSDKAPTAQQVINGQDASENALAQNRKGTISVQANVEGVITVQGLQPNTSYKVYMVVAKDGEQYDISAAPLSVAVKTSSDVVCPTFNTGYPMVDSITNNSARLSLSINENGKAYFVTVPKGSNIPTVLQIKQGLDAAGSQIDSNMAGSVDLIGNKTASVVISKLLQATGYDVYMVVEDSSANTSLSPIKVSFSTTNDNTIAPGFLADYPVATNIRPTAFDVLVKVNKPGKVYYAVYKRTSNEDGYDIPTPEAVKNGQCGGTMSPTTFGNVDVLPNEEKAINIVNVPVKGIYDVVFVTADASGNLASNVTPYRVRTISVASGKPNFIDEAPSVKNITNTTAVLSLTSDKNGRVYYIAVPAGGNMVPIPYIMAGRDASRQPVPQGNYGCMSTTAGEVSTATITGLKPGIAYDIFFIAQDNSPMPVWQDTIAQLTFKTNVNGDVVVDQTAPSFNPGYPIFGLITDATAQVTVSSNETGTVSYGIAAAGAAQPSLSQSVAVTANNTSEIEINGLEPDVSYDLYLQAKDAAGNAGTVIKKTFTTKSASDTVAPLVGIANVVTTDTQTVFNCLSNEDAKLYYVVLPKDAAAPSAYQIKAGQDYLGNVISLSGSTQASANVPALLTIGNLVKATDYSIWIAAEDASGNIAIVGNQNITTVSNAKLDYIPGYPSTVTVTGTTAQFKVKASQMCKLYYVVIPTTERYPNVQLVRYGRNAKNIQLSSNQAGQVFALGNTEYTINVSGLSVNTGYALCMVMEDPNGVIQNNYMIVNFNTVAN